MPACPRCGIEIAHPIKTWPMIGRPTKKGERPKLTLGLFMCSTCKKTFRKALRKEKITFEGVVDEIREIERRMANTLGALKEKLEKLKNERKQLLDEIEELKRAGEEKAQKLEKEVVSLREELESLKEILGG